MKPDTPRAAAAIWPYLHRTVAEIDALEASFADAERFERAYSRGAEGIDRLVGLARDRGAHGLQQRAALPASPCPSCGARGLCGHGGRIAA